MSLELKFPERAPSEIRPSDVTVYILLNPGKAKYAQGMPVAQMRKGRDYRIVITPYRPTPKDMFNYRP